jgi:hypothetical protein
MQSQKVQFVRLRLRATAQLLDRNATCGRQRRSLRASFPVVTLRFVRAFHGEFTHALLLIDAAVKDDFEVSIVACANAVSGQNRRREYRS